MTFEDMRRLCRGVHRVDFEEFYEVLKRTTGASESYARGCWLSFQHNALNYMDMRVPLAQGKELFKLAWKKGETP